VAAGALRTHHDAADLLFAPGGQERGALHRAHARLDADRPEIAVGVAGLRQELLGALGIVRGRVDPSANSMCRGTMLPVMPAKPSCSASFSVLRSIAWLAAKRTRRSCQGDFGSHCSVKSRKMTVLVLTAVSLSPCVFWMSSATGPPRK